MTRPQLGDCLNQADKSDEVLRFLGQRRSSLVKVMDGSGAGPNPQQLSDLLELSARVPDHRKLAPWRFVVFTGQARADFGEVIAKSFADECGDMPEDRVKFEADRFTRAHTVIAVISAPKNCPRGTPKWEQILSAGAVCFQMLLGARAMGFAAQWLTEWYAYDDGVKATLGLGGDDEIAGFMYIGEAAEPPSERARPDMARLVTQWGAA